MPFYHLPHPWNPGYAVPKYVLAEPPERGTFTTQWLPRGTISQIVPDYLAKPGRKILGRTDADLGSLGGTTLDCSTLSRPTLAGHSLEGSSLGAEVYTLEPLGAGGTDPVLAYGMKASSWIMSTISRVPQPQRKAALRALLDAIDPSLWSKVDADGQKHQAAGMNPKAALARALAENMSAGIAHEIVETGKRALRGDRQPVKAEGQLGLGAYPMARTRAQATAMEALGFSFSDLNPVNAVKNAARAVAGAATTIVKGTVNAAGEVWDGTKWVGGKIGAGAKAAGGWVKDGVNALGGFACKLASSPIGQVGASAAAVAAGAPPQVGVAGAQAAAAMCSKTPAVTQSQSQMSPPSTASRLPSWALPVGIGAGVLLLVAVARKK